MKESKLSQPELTYSASLDKLSRFAFILFLALAVLYLFSSAIHVFLSSKIFSLSSIIVFGNERCSAQEIIEKAGIKNGINIFSISLSEVYCRLSLHPWLNYIEINRRLPDTIVIKVRERKPVAYVNLNKAYILDENGHILQINNEKVNIPEICQIDFPLKSFDEEYLKTGDSFKFPFIKESLEIIRRIREYSPLLFPQLTRISFLPSGEIGFKVKGIAPSISMGRCITLNQIKILEMSINELKNISDKLGGIDLRFKDQIILIPLKADS